MQSVFAPGPASPTVRGSDGAIYAVSSFGVDGTTFGPDWNPQDVLKSLRRRALTFRRSFARCSQHDWKMFDSQGRFIHSGPIEYWQPLIGSSQPAHYVPLDQRRPAAPVRLAKLITTRFTSLVFGHGRFPKIRCPGDPDAEDFANALAEKQALPTVFVRARNMGGSTGTVGLSWRFCEGEPRTRVHDPASLHVHAWADKERCIVDHVTELQIVERDVWNPNTKKVEKKAHWLRRDWCPNADLVFCEALVTEDAPEWVLDCEETFIHNEGRAHFVWIQNIPPDEDGWNPDGIADYEGCEEPMLTLDCLSSVLNTGTIRNLDPTLKLKMDPEIVKRAGQVLKGSDNALVTGTDGDATYLELAGSSAQIGMSLRKEERQHVLDTANCVVPNPDEIAAAGTSGVAIELLYHPMLGQGDLLRTSYGSGLIELLDQQLESARKHYPVKDMNGEFSYPVEIDEEGEEIIVQGFLSLPQREIEEEVLDEEGKPLGEQITTMIDRHPGTSRLLKLEWPPYFPLTAQEQQAQGQALTTATMGKAVLSQRSGVEAFATVLGRDAGQEWERLQEEQRMVREAEQGMFLGIGGEVSTQDELPQGAAPVEEKKQEPEAKPPEEKPVETAQGLPLQVSSDQVLNGTQIQAAVAIVKSVVVGELPRDAGLGQLKVLFNLTPVQALAIMGSAGLGPSVPVPVAQAPAPQPAP